MLPSYEQMSKQELIEEIQRLHNEDRYLSLKRTVHELQMHREETRIQTERLIDTQRLLEESRDRYADLYEFAPLPYITLDKDGYLLEINLTATSFLGQERATLISRPFLLHILKEDCQRWLEHIQRCRTECGPIRTELRLQCAGRIVPVEIFSRISRTQGGPTFRSVIIDRTNPQRAEEDVRAASAQLEKRIVARTADLERAVVELQTADQRKNEFLAMLGHELRNPLAGIGHAVLLLKRDDTLPDERENALRVLERQLAHVSKLLNDLLDVARITQGKISLRKKPTNLVDVVRAALAMSQSFLATRGHDVQLKIPAESPVVDCDPERIEQVLQNLLHNAGKYTDPGGYIEIEVARVHHGAIISVTDTGIGMTGDELAVAFNLFTQTSSSRDRREGGLGLGLSLAKNLVELHGGIVQATSPGRGRGTRVEVRLPLIENQARPDSTLAEVDEEFAGERSCSILIIEDNRDAAYLLSKLLEMSGHSVRTAYDGQSGLSEATQRPPDIVLLDIGLPDMSGYEVARRLRSHVDTASTILVAMTGYGSDQDRQRASESGFHHHLTKPVSPNHLGTILKSFGARKP